MTLLHTTSRRTLGSRVATACTLMLAAAASAQIKPMLALDERLELTPLQVTSVGQSRLLYVDNRGRTRHLSLGGDVLALLPPSFDRGQAARANADTDAPPPSASVPVVDADGPRPWVTLVDGQRIVGVPDDEAAQDDALAWRHATLGLLVFPLERVRQIVFAPEASATPRTDDAPTADDLIVLRNGDRLTGFIVSVQPTIEIETEGQTLTIPTDRVSGVQLVNELQAAAGTHLWLTDGTRIGAHSLADPDEDGQPGVLLAHLESPSESPLSEPNTIPLHDVSAIALEAARLTALTDLAIEHHEPHESRRTSDAPLVQRNNMAPLGAGDVFLPGPMTVEWALPAGALRLAGWVTLPDEASLWGDCNIVIETIDNAGQATVTASARLRGVAPNVRINEELPAGSERLRIRLEPGEYGPVQDRVLLERFVLLTAP